MKQESRMGRSSRMCTSVATSCTLRLRTDLDMVRKVEAVKRTVRVTTRPPSYLDRMWYRYLGLTPPYGVTSSGFGALARLLPYRWRRFHHYFARQFGYFWKPCPLCGREYGGHELGSSIPDPLRGEGWGRAICSECTRVRNNDELGAARLRR